MITPTIGRVVWIRNRYAAAGNDQPECGLVCYVWGDRMINVAGFDRNGMPFALTSLPLRQPEDGMIGGQYAEWMPYQVKVAADQTS
jgi:hypothetical protein